MTNDEYQALLKDSELRLDRLRSLYEQWFQGLERREPKQQREEIERRVALFRREPPRNTALRFRTQTLIQRFVSLQTYWSRVAREIEDGTNFRTIQRARRRSKARDDAATAAERGKLSSGAEAFELDFGEIEDLDALAAALDAAPDARTPAVPPPPSPGRPAPLARPEPPSGPTSSASVAGKPPKPAGPPPLPPSVARMNVKPSPPPVQAPSPADAARPATPSAPPSEGRFARPKGSPVVAAQKRPQSPSAPAAASPPTKPTGPTDERIRDIYERYVAARRRNNERVDNIRLETLAASIEKMIPDLEQKHRGKTIDFEIVLKDGRVGLKPVPKG